MGEEFYADLTIKVGYFLLFSRVVLLLMFTVNRINLANHDKVMPLFYYALFGFLIAIVELVIIFLAFNKTEYIAPFLRYLGVSDTFFMSPFYFCNEVFFLGYYFSKVLNNTRILYLSSALVALEVWNTFSFEGFKHAQPIGSFLATLTSLTFSFVFIRKEYMNYRTKSLYKNYHFMIGLSIFIPSLTSIFYYMITKYLFQDDTILYYKVSILRMLVEGLGFIWMAYFVNQILRKVVSRKFL